MIDFWISQYHVKQSIKKQLLTDSSKDCYNTVIAKSSPKEDSTHQPTLYINCSRCPRRSQGKTLTIITKKFQNWLIMGS